MLIFDSAWNRRDKQTTQQADVTDDGMSTGDSAQQVETATHDDDQNLRTMLCKEESRTQSGHIQ